MEKYDPEKKYEWSNDDKFEISGRDLALILNTVRAILSTEMAMPILLADRTHTAVESLMAKYVEEGKIKEAEEKQDG